MAGMFDNLKQLNQLRQQAAQFQRMLAGKTFEVSSPGGEVRLKVNGKMEMLALDITAAVLVPEKKAHLERTLIRTWTSAQQEVERWLSTEMKSRMPGFPSL